MGHREAPTRNKHTVNTFAVFLLLYLAFWYDRLSRECEYLPVQTQSLLLAKRKSSDECVPIPALSINSLWMILYAAQQYIVS